MRGCRTESVRRNHLRVKGLRAFDRPQPNRIHPSVSVALVAGSDCKLWHRRGMRLRPASPFEDSGERKSVVTVSGVAVYGDRRALTVAERIEQHRQ